MSSDCKIICPKTGKFLSNDAEMFVPVISKSKICEVNHRINDGPTDEQLTAADFARRFAQECPKREDDVVLNISANTAAAAMCHNYSSNKSSIFGITRAGKEVTITANSNWEQEHRHQNDERRRKEAVRLGELSELAIALKGSGKMMLHHYTRQSDSCVRISVREIDAVNRNVRGKLEPVEIKGVGFLKMSKVRFFNKRLASMVSKAVNTGCPATYIVARDDRETKINIDGLIKDDRFIVMEDVRLLLLPGELKNFREFHAELCKKVLTCKDGVLWNCEDGISEDAKSSEKLKNKAKVPVPGYIDTDTDKLKTNIIVGPEIPYFEFRLSEFYMTYKHKHQQNWKMQIYHNEVVVLVRNSEELKEVFSKYNKHPRQKNLSVKIYSMETIDMKCLQGKFENRDIKNIVCRDFDELGTWLYKEKMTFWEKPVPNVLLILGAGEHVPLRLMTARLSFGLLGKDNSGEYFIGIDMGEIPKPDVIGIIGTKEECEAGAQLEFPEAQQVHQFRHENKVPENHIQGPMIFTWNREDKLIEFMKRAGFPMYKEFYFNENKKIWIAKGYKA